MLMDRRGFLRLPLGALVCHEVAIGRSAATLEEKADALGRNTLVLFASGFKLRDAPEGGVRSSGVIAVNPDDGRWRLLLPHAGLFRVSPDRRRIALLDLDKHDIAVCNIAGVESRRLPRLNGSPVWSPDGASLLISALPEHDQEARLEGQAYVTWKVELDGGEPIRTAIPATDFVSDWSGGDWVLGRAYSKEPEPGVQLFVSRPDGAQRRLITNGRAYHLGARFSPDGKRVVYVRQSREGSSIWVDDLDRPAPRLVLQGPIRFRFGACWAPDGERLAITRLDAKENRSTVEIVALKNLERTVLKLPDGHFNGCDWPS